jgi:hypothetical protein
MTTFQIGKRAAAKMIRVQIMTPSCVKSRGLKPPAPTGIAAIV